MGLSYQICDDIRDFLGKKQKHQKQKDFREKKVNSLVAFLSRDIKNHALIKNYLNKNREENSTQELSALEDMVQAIEEQGVVLELKKRVEESLTVLEKSNSSPLGKRLIGSYLNTRELT